MMPSAAAPLARQHVLRSMEVPKHVMQSMEVPSDDDTLPPVFPQLPMGIGLPQRGSLRPLETEAQTDAGSAAQPAASAACVRSFTAPLSDGPPKQIMEQMVWRQQRHAEELYCLIDRRLKAHEHAFQRLAASLSPDCGFSASSGRGDCAANGKCSVARVPVVAQTVPEANPLAARMRATAANANVDRPSVASSKTASAASTVTSDAGHGSDPTEDGRLVTMSYVQEDEWLRNEAKKRLPVRIHGSSSPDFIDYRWSLEEEPTEARFVVTAAESKIFNAFFTSITISYAALIGLEVELIAIGAHGQYKLWFDALDVAYCVVFLVELLTRAAAFGIAEMLLWSKDCAWNWLDVAIVLAGFVDVIVTIFLGGNVGSVSVLRLVSVLKITRILRIVRLMRVFRALRVLMLGIFSTIKSSIWSMMLLCMIIYTFSIIFTQTVADHLSSNSSSDAQTMELYYGTLPRTFYTLFMSIFGGIDWGVAVEPLFDIHTLLVVLFSMYVAFVTLAVMNVVTGLFCQTAMDAAHSDTQSMIELHEEEKSKFIGLMEKLFNEWDASGDGFLSLQEFEMHMGDKDMRSFLRKLEIDPDEAWTLFKLLDSDSSGGVDSEEFVKGCFRLKGGAKSMDVAEIKYQCSWIMAKLGTLTSMIHDHVVPPAERPAGQVRATRMRTPERSPND